MKEWSVKDFYFQARCGAICDPTTTISSPFRYFSRREDIVGKRLDIELEGERLTNASGRASTLTMLVATSQMVASRRKGARDLDNVASFFLLLWVRIGHHEIFGHTPESVL